MRQLLYLFGCAWMLLMPLAGAAQPKPLKVACIGNSVTAGLGHKNPAATAYPAQLQQLLGNGYEVRNFGHSGATLLRKGHNSYNKTKSFADALAFAPDIAIIHLGLNDTDPRNWPNYGDEFGADYTALIDTLRKANGAMRIVICRLTPIFPDHKRFLSGTRDWFWQIQKRIPQIAAANGVELIDYHTPLHVRPDLFPDALHPNEQGAAILAKTAYSHVTGNWGGLQLAPVFASHMVLQRERPIVFWGKANRDESIKVSFNGKTTVVKGDEQGNWQATFPSMKAGGPYKAVIASGVKSIVLEDVLVGDVWLCSGQSNMDFPLQAAINKAGEVQRAQSSSTIRLLNREPIAETDNRAWDSTTLEKVNGLQYFTGTWQQCDSVAAKKFSAVAYYYAQALRQQVDVPIGLIQVAVGGSTTESWIDRYSLEHHPLLVNSLTNWRSSDFFQPWVRQRADTNLKGSTNPKQRHPYDPAYNYEAGIADLVHFPISGAIWYQGESNAHNIELHEQLLPQLVRSWRNNWGYDFPFYYVQLSSLNRPSWPAFRASQLQLLQNIPHSGMAVTSDVGDSLDVHPRKKQEVGERLARLALHFTYGKNRVVPYGPMPLKAVHTAKGIEVHFNYAGKQLSTSDGKALRGFTLVNKKGITIKPIATIQQNRILLQAPVGEQIKTVQYGWQPFTDANLINASGLPASTFQMDVQQ
ncbi:GDSL-type esterase/lipase family protein [Pseudocnuella soli]|uniref:GDSL-type esterase/lipase family protein n=1 Tax=Pseudocnuella soli TaxID=2502779 RepID=UPI00104EE2FB|nr:GDSL-type esterase/lipase family protein [Pseudocnuella soli]